MQDEQGKWYFFRFWESSYIQNYILDLRNNKERSIHWFILKDDKISMLMLIPAQPDQVFTICPVDNLKHESTQKPFIFGELEEKSFRARAIQKFDKKLLNYLSERNAKFSALSAEYKHEILSRIIN